MKEKIKKAPVEYKGQSEKIKKFLGYSHEDGARRQYCYRLMDMEEFVKSKYQFGIDKVLAKLESSLEYQKYQRLKNVYLQIPFITM